MKATSKDVDLKTLAELFKAATPGPWVYREPHRYGEVVAPNDPNPDSGYDGKLIAESCGPPNARLIVAMHEATPELARRIEAAHNHAAMTIAAGPGPMAHDLCTEIIEILAGKQ